MRHDHDGRRGTGPDQGLGGPGEGAARAHQIVDDHRLAAGDVAVNPLAADHAATPPLVGHRPVQLPAEPPLQHLLEELGALEPARVGCHDHDVLAFEVGCQMVGKQAVAVERHGRDTKGVLERRQVVHLERQDRLDPDRLHHLGEVAQAQGVPGLRPPILPGIGEIGEGAGQPPDPGIPHRACEEEQATKLVVHGTAAAAVEALDDDRVPAAQLGQRADLDLTIFEHPLLDRDPLGTERLRHPIGEAGARCQ